MAFAEGLAPMTHSHPAPYNSGVANRDLSPGQWRRHDAIRSRLRTFLGRRGYDSVDTPVLESTDLFLRKSGGELAARMYSFVDPAGRGVSLRPEFTSSVVRAVAEGSLSGPLPLRVQYAGPVFRYEHISDDLGTALEFEQVGAELIGAGGTAADAEVIALAVQGLSLLGVKGLTVRLGHVGVTKALFDALGLTERARVFVLGSLAEMRQGADGAAAVRQRAEDLGMLSERRRASLTMLATRLEADDAQQMVEGFLADVVASDTGQRSPEEIVLRYVKKLRQVEDPATVYRALEFAGELVGLSGPAADAREWLGRLMAKYGIDGLLLGPLDDLLEALSRYDLMGALPVLDLGAARGIAYYTGAIFDIEHAGVTTPQSIGGGGRYDSLVRAFGGDRDMPALGYAISVDRIADLLPAEFGEEEQTAPPRVLVTAKEASLADAVATAERLRTQGIAAELDVVPRTDAEAARYAKQRGIETIMRVGRDGAIDERAV